LYICVHIEFYLIERAIHMYVHICIYLHILENMNFPREKNLYKYIYIYKYTYNYIYIPLIIENMYRHTNTFKWLRMWISPDRTKCNSRPSSPKRHRNSPVVATVIVRCWFTSSSAEVSAPKNMGIFSRNCLLRNHDKSCRRYCGSCRSTSFSSTP